MKVEIANPIYDIITSDNHILNVREEDFPEKYRPLIRRPKEAAALPEVKEQMRAEDEVFDYMKMLERVAAYKATHEERKKWEADMAEKDKELVKKDKELVKKDEELIKKDEEFEKERKKSEATARELEAALLKLQQAGLS